MNNTIEEVKAFIEDQNTCVLSCLNFSEVYGSDSWVAYTDKYDATTNSVHAIYDSCLGVQLHVTYKHLSIAEKHQAILDKILFMNESIDLDFLMDKIPNCEFSYKDSYAWAYRLSDSLPCSNTTNDLTQTQEVYMQQRKAEELTAMTVMQLNDDTEKQIEQMLFDFSDLFKAKFDDTIQHFHISDNPYTHEKLITARRKFEIRIVCIADILRRKELFNTIYPTVLMYVDYTLQYNVTNNELSIVKVEYMYSDLFTQYEVSCEDECYTHMTLNLSSNICKRATFNNINELSGILIKFAARFRKLISVIKFIEQQ